MDARETAAWIAGGRRVIQQGNGLLRDIRQASDQSADTTGAIKGWGGVADQAEGTRNSAGDRAQIAAIKAREARQQAEYGPQYGVQQGPSAGWGAGAGTGAVPSQSAGPRRRPMTQLDAFVQAVTDATLNPTNDNLRTVTELANGFPRGADGRIHPRGIGGTSGLDGPKILIEFGGADNFLTPQDMIVEASRAAAVELGKKRIVVPGLQKNQLPAGPARTSANEAAPAVAQGVADIQMGDRAVTELAEAISAMKPGAQTKAELEQKAAKVAALIDEKGPSIVLANEVQVPVRNNEGTQIATATVPPGRYSASALLDVMEERLTDKGDRKAVNEALDVAYAQPKPTTVATAPAAPSAPATGQATSAPAASAAPAPVAATAGAGTITPQQAQSNQPVADTRDYTTRHTPPVATASAPPAASAPAASTAAPAATATPPAAFASLPAADGKAWPLSKGADGKTLDPNATYPKMSKNQIIAFQTIVGATPDGLYGPVTDAKCREMCAKAGIKIEDLDLVHPNPKTQQFIAAAKSSYDTQMAAVKAPPMNLPETPVVSAHPIADAAKAAVKAGVAVLTDHAIRKNPDILVTYDSLEGNAFNPFATPRFASISGAPLTVDPVAQTVTKAPASPARTAEAPVAEQALPQVPGNQAAANLESKLGQLSPTTINVASAGPNPNQGRGA